MIDLFELGYVDSVGFAELLALLAEEFGVDVPENDLLSDDFLTIDGDARIVSRLSLDIGRAVPERAFSLGLPQPDVARPPAGDSGCRRPGSGRRSRPAHARGQNRTGTRCRDAIARFPTRDARAN
jgi:Phosphopantetheine attachment site